MKRYPHTEFFRPATNPAGFLRKGSCRFDKGCLPSYPIMSAIFSRTKNFRLGISAIGFSSPASSVDSLFNFLSRKHLIDRSDSLLCCVPMKTQISQTGNVQDYLDIGKKAVVFCSCRPLSWTGERQRACFKSLSGSCCRPLNFNDGCQAWRGATGRGM